MSRAFIKEEDGGRPESLLDRPLSPLPNFMTPEGHRLMSQELEQLQGELAALKNSEELSLKSRQAHLERDIRYCLARLQSARLVQQPAKAPDRVIFGCTVTFIDGHNNESSYQSVGEDEADIKAHKISWASPLARALMNKQEGEVGLWQRPAGTMEVEIIRIENCSSS